MKPFTRILCDVYLLRCSIGKFTVSQRNVAIISNACYSFLNIINCNRKFVSIVNYRIEKKRTLNDILTVSSA